MNKELFKKYLKGILSTEEAKEVKRLLSDPAAEATLQEILNEEWVDFETPEIDETLLNTYRQRFIAERTSQETQGRVIRPVWRRSWLKYAAIFLLASGIGFYAIYNKRPKNIDQIAFLEKFNPRGQRSVVTLSDSTVVYLGADSKIRFPENFTGKTRELELQGEAFFQVKKDHKHPFIIHTGNVQTMVLGTSFKIEAFKGLPLNVSVATGKVRVDERKNPAAKDLHSLAVLLPGQMVSYNPVTDRAIIGNVIIDDLEQWKMGNLIFNSVRMDRVAGILERYYDVHISIANKSIADYRVNASFKANEPVDKILHILGATAQFKYKIQGHLIKIKKI